MYHIIFNIAKYLVLAMCVYLLLSFIPNVGKSNSELLIITIILLLLFVLCENICSLFGSSLTNDGHANSNINANTCSSVCSSREFMENTVPKPEAPVVPKAGSYAATDKKNAERGIEHEGMREQEDVMTDESEFDNQDYNHLPMGENINTGNFEYGYSFLPPEKWYPTPAVPPICVAEKKCPVCPIFTSGTPVDVKEWNSSRRITQPDVINTKYIKKKLNSGR